MTVLFFLKRLQNTSRLNSLIHRCVKNKPGVFIVQNQWKTFQSVQITLQLFYCMVPWVEIGPLHRLLVMPIAHHQDKRDKANICMPPKGASEGAAVHIYTDVSFIRLLLPVKLLFPLTEDYF